MSERTYNLGRVVGWSAYEEFLKENPDVDPHVVTEKVYMQAVTYGCARFVRLDMTDSTKWVGNDICKMTVPVPGSQWGTVPMFGLYYQGLSGLADLAGVSDRVKLADEAFSHIYCCYASTETGARVTADTPASMTGYITFCAHTDIRNSEYQELETLPILIRGLGVDAWTVDTGNAYYGPAGMPCARVGGETGPEPEPQVVSDIEWRTVRSPDVPGNPFAPYVEMIDDAGRKFGALSLFQQPDIGDSEPYDFGGETDPNNPVTIELASAGGSVGQSDVLYKGQFTINDLIRMMTQGRPGQIQFTVKKADKAAAKFVDVTKTWAEYNRSGTLVYNDAVVIAGAYFGNHDPDASTHNFYRRFIPWDMTSTMSASKLNSYGGFYRVIMEYQPSDFASISKVVFHILFYLKASQTITNPNSGSSAYLATGCYYRGVVPDNIVTAAGGIVSENNTYTFIPDRTLGVNSIPSTPYTRVVAGYPTTDGDPYGLLSAAAGRNATLNSLNQDWMLQLTVKGVRWVSDLSIQFTDTSAASGSATYLDTFLGGQSSDTSKTYPAWTGSLPAISTFTTDNIASKCTFEVSFNGTWVQ